MELIRALGALVEPPSPESRGIADALNLGSVPDEAAHSDLFLFQLYPYASVYLGKEGMLGGEARDRIAGFWRALELEPPAEPDHLTVLLSLYSRLKESEEAAQGEGRYAWRNARKAFLWEHLSSWLPVYLAKLGDVASGPYRRWARILREVLAAEAEALGPPDRLPLHLREAPPLADPREEGGEAFLRSLLAPVRSGLILLRSDLQRAARELDLGSRVGERLFVLKSLLGQDASGLFHWLGQEAARAATTHAGSYPGGATVGEFWRGRAEAAGDLLRTLP